MISLTFLPQRVSFQTSIYRDQNPISHRVLPWKSRRSVWRTEIPPESMNLHYMCLCVLSVLKWWYLVCCAFEFYRPPKAHLCVVRGNSFTCTTWAFFFLSSFEGEHTLPVVLDWKIYCEKKISHCSSLESSLWFYKMACNEVRHNTTSSSWGRKSYKTWSIWNICFGYRIFGLSFVPELLDNTETQVHGYV